MYFVRRVVPHTIVVVHDDGSCDESEWLTDDFTPLSDLAEATGLRVHGSGTAARWGDGVNLALLHTKDEKGRYATMLYSFSSRVAPTVCSHRGLTPIAIAEWQLQLRKWIGRAPSI